MFIWFCTILIYLNEFNTENIDIAQTSFFFFIFFSFSNPIFVIFTFKTSVSSYIFHQNYLVHWWWCSHYYLWLVYNWQGAVYQKQRFILFKFRSNGRNNNDYFSWKCKIWLIFSKKPYENVVKNISFSASKNMFPLLESKECQIKFNRIMKNVQLHYGKRIGC